MYANTGSWHAKGVFSQREDTSNTCLTLTTHRQKAWKHPTTTAQRWRQQQRNNMNRGNYTIMIWNWLLNVCDAVKRSGFIMTVVEMYFFILDFTRTNTSETRNQPPLTIRQSWGMKRTYKASPDCLNANVLTPAGTRHSSHSDVASMTWMQFLVWKSN